MSEYRVAYRYAKSLLELSEEKGVLEAVHNDMQLFTQVVEANHDFHLLLKNPIVNAEKKQAVLNKIFEGKVEALTMSFFSIISRKGREAVLPAIAREFHAQYNIWKGIAEASVTTTFPLTEDLRKQFLDIIKEVSGKEVELKESVKEDLLGGFILKIGDRQVDESLSSKLKKLKQQFSRNPYVKEI